MFGYDPGLSGLDPSMFDPSMMDPMQQIAPLVPAAANPTPLPPPVGATPNPPAAAPLPMPGAAPGPAASPTPNLAQAAKGVTGFGQTMQKAGAAPAQQSPMAAMGAQPQGQPQGGQMGTAAIAALMQLMSGQKGGTGQIGFGGM